VVLAAQGEPVLEFGMRRAQGIDGSVSASRAAYVGGCAGTSNLLAGRLFGIPVKGTHAHSWVMCFDTEREAFQAYAEAMPGNVVFLVDTYDTLEGVRHAVEVGRWLRERGYPLLGVRLDSGDLAYLSIEARKILDAAGFADTPIVASSDLDEHIISSLKQQGATISVWGVGTRLATAYDQPALGGVYKLSALCNADGDWEDRIKLSEQAVKSSTPGILQVRRFRQHGHMVGDVVYDEKTPISGDCVAVDPADPTRRKYIPASAAGTDLLVPVFRGGRRVYQMPPLDECRRQAHDELAELHAGIKRLVNPHQYPAGLEAGLHQRKTDMILRARGFHA
jgi:nicotinate phosphoribosyltransferase